MNKLFATDDSWAGLILRVGLGVVFFPHGAQKLLGWFGGAGVSGTMESFTGMGMPAVVAILIILGESLGSIGLIVGFMTRLAALGLFIIMAGAVYLVHLPNGFFMNWYGTQAGEGFEYHILVLAICAALILKGAGKWSLDRRIASKSS